MPAKRFYPSRPKGLPKGYDSWPEYHLHQGLLAQEIFHPDKIPYTVDRKYEPDFLIPYDGGEYLLEFKGYFRDNQELSKYNWIRKALRDDQELLFIFDNPMKPIHFKPKRTDGSKMNCAEWALKNNFRYFDEESFTKFYKELRCS